MPTTISQPVITTLASVRVSSRSEKGTSKKIMRNHAKIDREMTRLIGKVPRKNFLIHCKEKEFISVDFDMPTQASAQV